MSHVRRTEVRVAVSDGDAKLFRKVTIRIVPLLWIVYFFNYLDRTNVAYAHLQMTGDLGFSDTVFGLGASLIFLGLILFEIPSNLLLVRIGLPKTLFRIMMLWGLCSAAMSLAKTPMVFYILRFSIGVFEAGLVPGALYYLTLWYPAQRRGQPCALFYTAPSCAGIASGPIAASFMTYMNGVGHFKGWQWLFVLEGLPCVLLACVVIWRMSENPSKAKWLSVQERRRVEDLIREGNVAHHTVDKQDFMAIARDPRLWILCLTGFLMLVPQFALTFWQPTLLRGMGLSVIEVGLYSALPALCGVVVSVIVARHSDGTGERCWHYITCALAAATGMFLTTRFPSNTVMTLVCLALTWSGFTSAYAMLWTFPGRIFSGRVAAVGLATITLVHGSAGMVGPFGLALIKTATGGFNTSFYVGSAMLVASALVFYPFFSSKAAIQLNSHV